MVSLDLSFQAIRHVPDEIANLKKLKNLTLIYCVLLESISSKLSLLPEISEVNVRDCMSIRTPPPEICKRGSVVIIAYLKRLLTGSVLYKRSKLMLVGLGEAGKTSLVNSLIKTSNSQNLDRPLITDGIDIKDWDVELPDKSRLTYSIWDFAGQSVYYNSHQFFLTNRAVYLLIWLHFVFFK